MSIRVQSPRQKFFFILSSLLLLSITSASSQALQFQDVTNSAGVSTPNDPDGYGHGVAAGDFNNDGLPDIYVTSYTALNALFLNDGDGSFTNHAVAAGVAYTNTLQDRGVGAADYDNDGDVDLYIASSGYAANLLFRNNGNGSFSEIANSVGLRNFEMQGESVSWGDYDGDGDLDLFLTSYENPCKLFRQNSDHSFTDVTAASGLGHTAESVQAVFFDADLDGNLDIFVSRGMDIPNSLFMNRGNGTFVDEAYNRNIGDPAPHGQGVTVGDYDNDGDFDIYMCDDQGPNRLYRNNNGSFTEVAGEAGVDDYSRSLGCHFADFDNDGWLDLYVINFGTKRLYRNNGDGTFSDESSGSGADNSDRGYGSVVTDYDGDGLLDIYFSNSGQNSILLRNVAWTNNRWLQFKLRGVSSNRNGIGARVIVTAGGQQQTQQLLAGFAMVSGGGDLTFHFGLGNQNSAERVEVIWPSGQIDVLTNLTANQALTIQEGDYGAGNDTEPPIISNVQSSNLSSASATIAWTTNEPAGSQVEYGLKAAYGNSTLPSAALSTNHAIGLTGLTANTTYHYCVKSKDAAGNLAVSGDFIFGTTSASSLSFTDITLSAGTGGPTGANQVGGHAAIFSDVNNDNRPDLYITMLGASQEPMADLFFRNTGNNVFAEEGALRGVDDFDGGSHGACFGDLDNDGDYDLYNGTTDPSPGVLAVNNVLRNDGSGFFTDVTAASGIPVREWQTRAVVAFDMEGDGDLDLFAVTDYLGSDDPPSDRNEVYRNDGGLQFTAVNSGPLFEALAGQGATDTDFDGDGDVDILTANRTGDLNILRNDGNGVFVQIAPASLGIDHRADDGITSADIDNDGDLDLLLARDDSGTLYRNLGSGTFAFAQNFTATNGYMGGFGDLDNDGDLDLVFAGDDVSYLNEGTGNFTVGPGIAVAGIDDPRAIGLADIDNDGDLDFAFGCKRSRNWLVRNDNASNNWLKIKLLSPQGQAGAFGAKTKIYPAGQAGSAQLGLRESRSNNGYLGQDDQIVHFGLGERTAVDVVVRFPDGTTVTAANVNANQTIIVNGVSSDAVAPVISQTTASDIANTGAAITWQTNEISSSQVEYGTTTALGSFSNTETILRSRHSVVLANLIAQTTYHYRVISQDHAGNLATSGNFTFTTSNQTVLLFDDFNAAGLDAGKWNRGANSGNQTAIQNGELALQSSGTQSGWIVTKNSFSGANKIVKIKVVQPNDDGDLGMSPTVNLASTNAFYGQNNWYRFYVYRNNHAGNYLLHVAWKRNGATGGLDVGNGLTLATPFWLRLRTDAANIYFEYSSNDASWVTAHQEPFNLPGSSLSNNFFFEIAANRTGTNGILKADDFYLLEAGGVSDTQPPVISQVANGNISANTAAITWNTDEAGDSQVEYGVTASYGFVSALDVNLVTAHSVVLNGLSANTTYHYRVKSRDAASNLAQSGDFAFTTAAASNPPVISNVTAANITTTTAQITFNTDHNATGSAEYDTQAHGVTRVMPLGDSITEGTGSSDDAGYRSGLYDKFSSFGTSFDFVGSMQFGAGIPDLDHEGHAGWTADEIYAGLDNFLNQAQPQAVLLHIGTNDVTSGENANTVYNDIAALTGRIFQHDAGIKLYLSTLIPRKDNKQSVNDGINNQLPGLVSSRTNAGYRIFLVDNSAAFTANNNWSSQWMADNVHPNDAGYEVMAQAWYETYTATEYDLSASSGAMATAHAITLTNLTPGTLYHYRARAQDSASLESASAGFTFTTLGDQQPPVISDVASSTITSSSATITWNTNEAGDSQVEYGLTTSYGSSSPLDALRITNHSVNLNGLNANTTYHYRVKSRDAAGNLGVSGDFTFVTSATGGSILSDAFSGNSLDANKWTRGANSGNQTVVTGGALHLRSTNNVSGWVHTREKFSASNKIIQIKVVQPNGDGTIGMSPTANSAAPAGFFEEPDWYRFYNYRSGNSGPYKLFVQWKKNGAEGGLDVAAGVNFTGNFHLRLRTTETEVFFEYSFDNSNWTTAYSETFSLPDYTLDDLFAFELSAYNTPSTGEWVLDDFAIKSTLSNDDTTAPMISQVASGNITTTTATISWSTDEPANAQVEYGTTTSYGSFSPVDPALATAHAIALSGLTQNTTYHFRVLSRDAAGNLGISEDNTFTTSSLSSGNIAFANVQGIFNRNCVRCHQGNDAPEQLVLAEGEAYGNIVNVASTQYPQWLRVHPGNRGISWLHEKITNPNPPVGSKMENLSADEIALIGKWIDQGATAEPAPPYAELEFRTTSLPVAEIEINYHAELVVWGGLPAYTFSVIAGSLPPGLSLDPNSGEIFGTPTATGQYSFTLRVNDRQTPAAAAMQAYTLEVRSSQAHWQVPQNFEVQAVVSDLDMPVNLAFVPNPGPNPDDPYFYITQLYGQVIMVPRDFQKQVYASNLLNFDPRTTPNFEELGVEGVAVDAQTGDVFATIIYNEAGATFGKVVRFHSTDGGRTAASQTTILEGIPAVSSHSLHTLTIGPDGKLYLNVGDGQNPDAAQDVNDKRGKILRMNLDGSLPEDNPFPNSYTYAYGFRNPFGAAWRNEDDELYISDNGQGTNDRLAQVLRGEDYGWPYDLTRGAIYLWNPTVAPVAMDFLRDTPFAPEYAGRLFVGLSGPTYLLGATDRGKRIQSFELDAGGNVASESLFLDYIGAGYATVIGVAFGPDGLYFTDLYGEDGFDEAGFTHANVYRIRWISQDTTAPVISNVQVSNVNASSALIMWQTNEPAKRQVEYGTTTDYGQQTALENDLRTSHSVVLNDLTPNTTYHFRARSWDAANNRRVSEDFSFTTATTDTANVLLSDDFNSSVLDANKWNKGTNNGNLSAVASNQLELRSSGTQTGWIITKNNYAARNTTASVKITQPNDDGNLGLTPSYTLASTNGIFNEATWYRFYVYRDVASGPYQLFVQWKKNGVVDGLDVTGNAVLNGAFYMRMRCDDTRIYFEFSVDGQVWNTAYSEPFGLTGYTLNNAFYYELAGYRTEVKGILKADDFAINSTSTGPDTQPPVISQVASGNVGTTTATITWNTDEASDSQVEYGATTSYGSSSPLNNTLVTAHSVALDNLSANTAYHYRVKSKDAAGNLATGNDFTFTTSATGGSTLFADDFNTATLDLNKWTKGSNSGNQATVINNALELRSTGTQTAWIVTKQKYAARNTIVTVKAAQPNNDGDLGMTPTFQTSSAHGIFNQANWYRFYVYRDVNSGPYRLYVQWSKNGAVDGLDVTGSLNITGTVYLRLRCDDSHIHFEASLNGQTWTDTYNEVFALPGYTLDSAFNYELAGYWTDVKGRITVDDFTIITSSALAKGGDEEAPAETEIPTAFALSQNYPNPFYFNTHMRVALPEAAQVHAVIYDINGREVWQLYQGQMPTGYRVMNWNGTNAAGEQVSSGVYFMRVIFETPAGRHEVMTRQLRLMR